VDSKRKQYRDSPDPEHKRWGKRYPKFPGVAECMRLIESGQARGSWADIIAYELAENADSCLDELISVFHSNPSGDGPLYVMMALDIARPPAAVPFLAEVLAAGDPRFVPYAARALRGIDNRAARTALFNAGYSTKAD
jgi:hypothetical protein